MAVTINLDFVADAGGTADVITATYNPAPPSLYDGLLLFFFASAANATTTPTFNPNGLGARTIVKKGGSALAIGDIPAANALMCVAYDLGNTRWELLNPSGDGRPHIEQITRANLIAKRNANLLEYGATGADIIYEVTDPSANNLNIIKVQLRANSPNTFEQIGQAEYWYPDHQIDSVSGNLINNKWKAESLLTAMGSPAYIAGDVVIYWNRRWVNLTNTNTDIEPDGDAVNWDFVPYSLVNGYIKHWNEVVYDLDQDLIIYRREDIINTNIFGAGAYWTNGYKPCQNEVWLDEGQLIVSGEININVFEWGCSTDCHVSGLYSAQSIRANDSVRVDHGCFVNVGGDVNYYSGFAMSVSTLVASGKVNIQDLHIANSSLTLTGDYTTGIVLTKSQVSAGSTITMVNTGLGVISADSLECRGSTIDIQEAIAMTDCRLHGVDFTLNPGGAGHDISGSFWEGDIITMTVQNMTGAKAFNLSDSRIYGEQTILCDDTAVTGQGMTIDAVNNISFLGGGTIVSTACKVGKFQNPIVFHSTTTLFMNYAVIQGQRTSDTTWIFSTSFGCTDYSCQDKEVRKDEGNMSVYGGLDIGAVAYNGATTYNLGDKASSGTKYFVYINTTSGAGNAPPVSGRNAYWAEYWDANTFTLPSELTWAGIISFLLNAPATFDFIYGLQEDFTHEFIADTSTLTITRTPVANAGVGAGGTAGDCVFTTAANFVLSSIYHRVGIQNNGSFNLERFRIIPT